MNKDRKRDPTGVTLKPEGETGEEVFDRLEVLADRIVAGEEVAREEINDLSEIDRRGRGVRVGARLVLLRFR